MRGTRVPVHIHMGAIGNESRSARGYMHLVHKRLKRQGISSQIWSISDAEHKTNYINYCYRQADSFHQYGNSDFDFKKYVDKDTGLIQQFGKICYV